jgi:D-3-phosphoglycerate dehydrogenase
VEIAEAVAGALAGELSATAVNAPMVPAEVGGNEPQLSS